MRGAFLFVLKHPETVYKADFPTGEENGRTAQTA
jgi:hypothetical protein